MREQISPSIKIGNERSDLLKQIEAGKKLRPIELKKRQSQVKNQIMLSKSLNLNITI